MLWLSSYMIIEVDFLCCPSSDSNLLSQIAFLSASYNAMYLALQEDSVMIDCYLIWYEIKPSVSIKINASVDLQSSTISAKSELL